MAKSFENLHDWAKDKYKKSTVEALNRYEKHSLPGKRKIKPFFRKKSLRKINRAVRSRARQTKHKIGLGKLITIA